MSIREERRRFPNRTERSVEEKVPFEQLQFFTDCTVDSTGPGEDDVVWVQLSCAGAFESTWFTALAENNDRVLLTALAVMENGWRCDVAVTGTEDRSEIYRIHPRTTTER